MTERAKGANLPVQQRNQKRWAIAAGIVVGWIVLLVVLHSVLGATVLLAVLAGLCVVAVKGLRALGIPGDRPRLQRSDGPSWRSGDEWYPDEQRPASQEWRAGGEWRPRDDPRDEWSGREEWRAGEGWHAEGGVPEPAAKGPHGDVAYASPQVYPGPGSAGHDDQTQLVPRPPSGHGPPTVMEQSISSLPPALRLRTGDSVAETRMSGARAGRGAVELGLPDVPTVSREHAKFIFSGGQWRVANLGMNGLTVNGNQVAAECPIRDGDLIRWGTRPDALLSRVEIG